MSAEHVNIKPGVGILSVLRHLNYKPWFALAEFVDNSLQSYISNKDEIIKVEGEDFRLKVHIDLDLTDEGRITIRDNAAGIHERDFSRAFRPAEVPADRTGLSEFGMGMKSASCWFANQWTVRTSALNTPFEKTIDFDISNIVRDDIEELEVKSYSASLSSHYTVIVLKNLHKIPKGKTISKIKEHLSSIYRIFIREGILTLIYNGDPLTYETPKIMFAPYYKKPSDPPKLWRKDITFDFGLGTQVYGFVALREVGSTSSAGFGLFRRNRLIEGSADDSYRPEYIFGRHNSFVYQRLFGELHLDGFEVSHTKDGFRWEEHEDIFLEFLKEKIQEEPLPLLEQAEGYRVRPKLKDLVLGAEKATEKTAEVIKREIPQIIEQQINTPPDANPPPLTLPLSTKASQRTIDINISGSRWQIVLELSDDPSVEEWVGIYEQPSIEIDVSGESIRRIGIRLSLAHPFTENFGGSDPSRIEPLLRIACAIVLAEITARDSGVKLVGTVRRNINDLLKSAFSLP